jgi:hypothetical protein
MNLGDYESAQLTGGPERAPEIFTSDHRVILAPKVEIECNRASLNQLHK